MAAQPDELMYPRRETGNVKDNLHLQAFSWKIIHNKLRRQNQKGEKWLITRTSESISRLWKRKAINKDTELHPLVRLQFRGLPEEERKAWYFDNVYDAKGKKYDIPVVIGVLGASPQVYAIGIQCEVDQIRERWQKAMKNPIQPVMVKDAPVHEVVLMGDDLLSRDGLGEFPIPLSTPGWDV
ncbi:hypothetical protein ACFLVE_04295, partial [Chloroflexota bacterium]